MKIENEMPVRFGLEMSQDTEKLLCRLAAKDDSTPSQVMSKALALFDVAARAIAKGQRLIVTDGEFTTVGEIVGLFNTPHVGIMESQLNDKMGSSGC
ncbi:hypothetical protein [Pseudoduganella danionis]|uniref:hypothetical protein n=1 Tax=Pseudoduganella danionis TaxID=1890295 RepID=UPI0035B1B34A